MKRVTTKVVIDIVTGVVLHRESYLYAGPWALCMDAFEPDITHFRFYEDGTEAGSSPVAGEDVNVTGRGVDSDSQIQLRLLMDELGAGSIDGGTIDDYELQYRVNGAGGWIIPTGASDRVRMDSGSSLTDGAATTNRGTDGLTDGAGSFVPGEQMVSDAEMANFQLTADNFTELVWGLLLVSADFADGDFVDFRVRYNGGSPGMDNTQVPRITVTKAAAGGQGMGLAQVRHHAVRAQ